MMTHLVIDKVEEALAALITEALGTELVVVATGKTASDRTLPIVICAAQGMADEDPPMSGNFWVEASVMVRTSSDDDADAKTKSQELVSAVFEALMVDDLADQLTAAVEDLTVFPNSMVFGAPESGKDEKGAWIDSMGVKMYCCAAAIG